MRIKRFCNIQESQKDGISVPPVPPVTLEIKIPKSLVKSIIRYAADSGLDMDDLTLEMKQNFVSLYITNYLVDRGLEDLEEKLYDNFEGGGSFQEDWEQSLQMAYDKITE